MVGVGILVSFWETLFSGAMLVWGRVLYLFFLGGGFKSYFSMSQERIPSLAPQDTPAAVDQGTHFVELNN